MEVFGDEGEAVFRFRKAKQCADTGAACATSLFPPNSRSRAAEGNKKENRDP